jgi:hypothetical protein
MYYSGTITGNSENIRRERIQKLVPYFEANGITADQVRAFSNEDWQAALDSVGLLAVAPHSTTKKTVITILDPKAFGSKAVRKSWMGEA